MPPKGTLHVSLWLFLIRVQILPPCHENLLHLGVSDREVGVHGPVSVGTEHSREPCAAS